MCKGKRVWCILGKHIEEWKGVVIQVDREKNIFKDGLIYV